MTAVERGAPDRTEAAAGRRGRVDPTTAEGRRELWRAMVRARAFDQAMCAHNPHWHEARGEEAVVVGGFAGLDAEDAVAPHFRGACAVSLMRGEDPAVVAAGVFGTSGSRSGGHWRGDICPTPGDRMIGMFSGSLGTTVSYATGAALHLSRLGGDAVVVCGFGDGTANAGIVSESLNLAAMLSLPIVFICQNNQYATSLRASRAIAGGSMTARAAGFGIPAVDVDGNDVLAVLDERDRAVDRARRGGGPSLLHALTYRLGGHYLNDPEAYRSAEEVAAWRARDPLTRFADELARRDGFSRDDAEHELARETDRMKDLVERAKEEAPPVTAVSASAYAEDWGAAS
ncbi:thiamine pyrophosphate-dependent dehydrogenase E1 component subunit alpha [Actinomadura chibensis]|uniref:Thiamine pyrophosphate-dependent dehydrogenase E1 component subunit alpha n=1 Tax=Actinomadura chibensis TaxID=392828 RepID=A0A5D0NLI2_9ACTN|nr:thiamine pyrophosphate-dependent dehydrogenase E1 component subunit alpha [Actinomadura chibensis]TYB44994.1 thiamine pyrophosphate-dependent dehydrogenase E1 component subunit alpha [Actinomadura chibensis]